MIHFTVIQDDKKATVQQYNDKSWIFLQMT